MRRPGTALLGCFALLLRPGPAEAGSEYYAICDAGSTGTRLYIFDLDISKSTAKSLFVKKTKPALTTYASNPSDAVPPLLELFKEGAEKVPKMKRPRVQVMIVGTAGMRMLDEEVQDRIWKAVRDGIMAKDSGFPFSKMKLETRTASGVEEGTWALTTANFLTGRVTHSMIATHEKEHPIGLMDLGGGSTQIAVPTEMGAVVHSYLGFGMTHIREQIHNESRGGEDLGCYMRGTAVGSGKEGTGDAQACRTLLSRVLAGRRQACIRGEHGERPCLGDLGELDKTVEAIKKGTIEFFGAAGMLYVADFVHWWLGIHAKEGGKLPSLAWDFKGNFPKPTIAELQSATDVLCSGDYGPLAKLTGTDGAHRYTQEDNAPYRCFQANYVLVLLEEIYGFSRDGRTITFAAEHEGEDLEWPLGAMLFKRSGAPVPGERAKRPKPDVPDEYARREL